jgi:hypothetical protein
LILNGRPVRVHHKYGKADYRCRGSGCRNAPLVAKAIEALLPKLFAAPSPAVDEQARIIFEYVARIWDDLIIPNRRRELVSLVRTASAAS